MNNVDLERRRAASKVGKLVKRKQDTAYKTGNRAIEHLDAPANQLLELVDEFSALLDRLAKAWGVEPWQVVEWLRLTAALAETGVKTPMPPPQA